MCVVRKMRCPVIVVGCLVVDKSSIATGSLSSPTNTFSEHRQRLTTEPYSRYSTSSPTQESHQSIPYTWTDKDDAFERSCSSWWNQQAAAADI